MSTAAQAMALPALLNNQTPLKVVDAHGKLRLIAPSEVVARRCQRALRSCVAGCAVGAE